MLGQNVVKVAIILSLVHVLALVSRLRVIQPKQVTSLLYQRSLRSGTVAVAAAAASGKSMGIKPSSVSGSDNVSNTQGRSRRKMGPPQRKLGQDQVEMDMTTGRVSVYCVGAEVDLVALRAHVFRRGFGSASLPKGKDKDKEKEEGEQSQLFLARGRGGAMETDEDEFLHVTNAPLYVSTGQQPARPAAAGVQVRELEVAAAAAADLVGGDISNGLLEAENSALEAELKLKEQVLMATQDIFYFDYGCVVFWGLTPMEERAALTELREFTTTPVSAEELDNSFDTLEFVFDRKANPQRPIRFDRMRLRSLQVEEKLALSYAMAQSSKLFVFESKIFSSLEKTRYLPKELATQGKINSSKRELNKIIGQLFVEQTEVNLFSSILDTPDFLWDDDEHVPAYQYLRNYLEVDDRVSLLNSRLSVIRELLDVLTAQVADNNSARLEWIVIWLISIEIIMGIASSPMFAGRRFLTALAVPTAIIAYKRINWTGALGWLSD